MQSHIYPSGRGGGKADLGPLSWCCSLLSTQESTLPRVPISPLQSTPGFWSLLPSSAFLPLAAPAIKGRLFAVRATICGHWTSHALLPSSHLFTISEDWAVYTPTGLNVSKSHSPAVAVNSWHGNIFVFSGCSASPGLFTACTLLRSLVSPLHISCIT